MVFAPAAATTPGYSTAVSDVHHTDKRPVCVFCTHPYHGPISDTLGASQYLGRLGGECHHRPPTLRHSPPKRTWFHRLYSSHSGTAIFDDFQQLRLMAPRPTPLWKCRICIKGHRKGRQVHATPYPHVTSPVGSRICRTRGGLPSTHAARSRASLRFARG